MVVGVSRSTNGFPTDAHTSVDNFRGEDQPRAELQNQREILDADLLHMPSQLRRYPAFS